MIRLRHEPLYPTSVGSVTKSFSAFRACPPQPAATTDSVGHHKPISAKNVSNAPLIRGLKKRRTGTRAASGFGRRVNRARRPAFQRGSPVRPVGPWGVGSRRGRPRSIRDAARAEAIHDLAGVLVTQPERTVGLARRSQDGVDFLLRERQQRIDLEGELPGRGLACAGTRPVVANGRRGEAHLRGELVEQLRRGAERGHMRHDFAGRRQNPFRLLDPLRPAQALEKPASNWCFCAVTSG